MKKIFWTTIFWLGLIVLFGTYIKLFDANLANQVAGIVGKKQAITGEILNVINTGNNVNTQFDIINSQIDTIAIKIDEMLIAQTKAVIDLSSSSSTAVKLYYFNQKEDQKLPPEQQVNINSIMPVVRTIPASDNIIRDTINLLIQGELTDTEVKQGFTTEFPNKYFHITDLQLSSDGVLNLGFNEVPGFTDGGSARMLVLSNSIIKTAMQFPEVKKVILPDILFQP